MVIIIDPDAEECNYSIKPLLILCCVIACMCAIPSLIAKNIIGIVISIFLIMLIFTSGLFVNRYKYFKSQAWSALKHEYDQQIKIILALNKSIKLIQKEWLFDITVNCSLQVFDESKINPFGTICNTFDISANQKTIKWLENIKREFKIAEKERLYIEKEKEYILKHIKKRLPFWIRIVTWKIENDLGINNIVQSIRYPCYRFAYYSVSGGFYQTHEIVLNNKTINEFKKYIDMHNRD